jgi:hypothetical protein
MLTQVSDTQDTLSMTLSKMKLKAMVAVGMSAAGNWGMEFPAYEILRLNMVIKGDCWLSIDGEKTKHYFKAGDCFLQPVGKRFVISKDKYCKKVVQALKLAGTAKNGIMSVNGGGDFFGSLWKLSG